MIPPILMLKIQELPGAMPLHPTVVLLLDPSARVRPPVRVCHPANAPSGSRPGMVRVIVLYLAFRPKPTYIRSKLKVLYKKWQG